MNFWIRPYVLHALSILKRLDLMFLIMSGIDNHQKFGFVIDPTIRFESAELQPQEVHLEKKRYYEPCFPYLEEKYHIPVCRWEVIGLLFDEEGPEHHVKPLPTINPPPPAMDNIQELRCFVKGEQNVIETAFQSLNELE
ncbi:hypothetical protein ANN_20050 [Periplaneta americana]|uniref:Uncharacterized protein n=1 Tax=Periplaneta americana TaxID=6978 RepID=A0ABQ8SCP2_PERAM|nr:hypothetical protein ANN_20050 [Periplaneta americana]